MSKIDNIIFCLMTIEDNGECAYHFFKSKNNINDFCYDSCPILKPRNSCDTRSKYIKAKKIFKNM